MAQKLPRQSHDQETVAMDPPYIPFVQGGEYCCVPACIQMILYRRGIPLLSQGTISKGLRTGMPKKETKRFSENIRAAGPPYGTYMYALNPFFQKQKIDLMATIVNPTKIHDVIRFVRENILQGNDMIAMYNRVFLDKAPKEEYHAVLMQKLDDDCVTCVDPYIDHPELWEVSIPDLLYAMDEQQDAFCIIHSRSHKSRQALRKILSTGTSEHHRSNLQ